MEEVKQKIEREIQAHKDFIKQAPKLAQYHLGFLDGLTLVLELLQAA